MKRALLPPPGGSNSGTVTNNGAGQLPAPGSGPSGAPAPTPGLATSGSLGNVPTADRGAYGASTLVTCGIAVTTGAYWIGFLCAAAVIVGVRMVSAQANCVM